MVNQKKVAQVDSFSNLMQKYSNFVVIEYNKTSHIAMEGLRKKLRGANASFKVLKNTLFEKTVEKMARKEGSLTKMTENNFPLKGPSAMVGLSEDWSEGLKAYYDHAKKDETLSFKFGFIDQNVYQPNDLEKIAKLPSKPELMAKVIGGLKTPMIKTVFAMKFNMQKLVVIMNAKVQKGEAAPVEAAASASTEAPAPEAAPAENATPLPTEQAES